MSPEDFPRASKVAVTVRSTGVVLGSGVDQRNQRPYVQVQTSGHHWQVIYLDDPNVTVEMQS